MTYNSSWVACFDSWMDITTLKLSSVSVILLWESEAALHMTQRKPSFVWVNHISDLTVRNRFILLLFKLFCSVPFLCLIAFISLIDLYWYSLGTHKVLLGIRERERERERESMNDSKSEWGSVGNSLLESTHCFPSADGGFLSKCCQDYHERIW